VKSIPKVFGIIKEIGKSKILIDEGEEKKEIAI
jgi:hypothetical protein